MQYFDKNGKEIKAGMKILMEDVYVDRKRLSASLLLAL